MDKRKLLTVALCVSFLTLVVVSYNMCFETPATSTEAMVFLQEKPFPNSLEEGTNTSSFNSDTNGSDFQVQSNVEGTKNLTDTDNPVTGPTEASAEADALVKDTDASEQEETKEGDSETTTDSSSSISVESSPQVDATVEPPTEIESPNFLTGSPVGNDTSKQNEDDLSDTERSESSVIAMEGPQLTNITSPENPGACDLFEGSWVPDTRPPQYTNSTCKFIQGHQDCMKNGRPDTGYLHWKWQPYKCDLPRIDARAFLSTMRGRSVVFAGDSISRNQFQSLLCILSQAEMPFLKYQSPDDKNVAYVFPSTNFTFTIRWSPYLVHVEEKQVTRSDNETITVPYIHIDELDKSWADYAPGADILQLSTGQWWFKPGLFLQGGQPIGGHTCDGWETECKEIGFSDAYRTAIRNVLQGILSIPGFTGSVVFRSFSPDHFENGRWDNGGECVRTTPGGVAMHYVTKWMLDIQKEAFKNVTGTLNAADKLRIKMLNVTNIAQFRADAHPNVYRTFQPYSKEHQGFVQKDCLHWCLPGSIDTWNDLLVQSLQDVIHR